ncbi:MAG: hypothetical protein ACK5AY_01695 [Bacteroidota bacterium]|jgi:predicted nuclease with TOPRIM domain
METKKIIKEISENGHRKVNIGVKAFSELKLKLSDEAKELGISLSEHCENILITHSDLLCKIKSIEAELEELRLVNASLTNSLSKIDLSSLNKKINDLNDENTLVKKQLAVLKNDLQIFSDSRLNDLYQQVKGKSDKILTDNGEMNITFKSPKDVLLALIYSYSI